MPADSFPSHKNVKWGWGWVGVGWDNNVIALAFSCTSTSTSCYAAVFTHLLIYSDGLRTLLIADGARCYPGLAKKKTLLLQQCNHSKGIFCIKKKLKQRGWVKVHTGNIDCFWKGAKKSIPGSLSSKVKGRRNVQLWKCLRRFQWRWEHTGKDMCKHTSKTLRTL